jgi:hypothetical protein
VISPLDDEGPALQVQGPLLDDPQLPLAVLQVWPLPQGAQVAPPDPHRLLVSLA